MYKRQEQIEVVFSHYHAVDLEEHRWIRFLTDKGHNVLKEEEYFRFMEELYIQTDYYLGKFFDRLDEGWTILIISDHGQVCPQYDPPAIGDATGVNVGIMKELGFTVLKQDENGNDLREIDWSKTRAIAVRGNHIYLNLQGRSCLLYTSFCSLFFAADVKFLGVVFLLLDLLFIPMSRSYKSRPNEPQ